MYVTCHVSCFFFFRFFVSHTTVVPFVTLMSVLVSWSFLLFFALSLSLSISVSVCLWLLCVCIYVGVGPRRKGDKRVGSRTCAGVRAWGGEINASVPASLLGIATWHGFVRLFGGSVMYAWWWWMGLRIIRSYDHAHRFTHAFRDHDNRLTLEMKRDFYVNGPSIILPLGRSWSCKSVDGKIKMRLINIQKFDSMKLLYSFDQWP